MFDLARRGGSTVKGEILCSNCLDIFCISSIIHLKKKPNRNQLIPINNGINLNSISEEYLFNELYAHNNNINITQLKQSQNNNQ